MIKTLHDTIIWYAEERMKEESYQNICSAIHAIMLDITQYNMEYMKGIINDRNIQKK